MKNSISKIILTSLIILAGAQPTPAKAIDFSEGLRAAMKAAMNAIERNPDTFHTAVVATPIVGLLGLQGAGWIYLSNRKWNNKPISAKQLGICHLPALTLVCFLAWQTP
jgi:hypothetical protein